MNLQECEELLQREYSKDIERLDEYINDAYSALEQAQEHLFMKSNSFSLFMDLNEFKQLMLKKLKDML